MRRPDLWFVLRAGLESLSADLPGLCLWLAERANEVHPQNDVQVFLSRAGSRRPFDGRAFDRAAKALGEGVVSSIGISARRNPERGGDNMGAVIRVGFPRADVLDVSFYATFTMEPLISADFFVEHSRHLAELVRHGQGLLLPLVPPSLFATDTPLELEPERVTFGPAALERYVRGVGWGMWLSIPLVEVLQEAGRVLAQAPVFRVIETSTGTWLQLTADPWDIPSDRIQALGDFLSPIMPTGNSVRSLDSSTPAPFPDVDVPGPGEFVVEGVVDLQPLCVFGTVGAGEAPLVDSTVTVLSPNAPPLAARIVGVRSLDRENRIQVLLDGVKYGQVLRGARIVYSVS
jgi:hypothetical protein